jgi:alkylhydroperoxidase/carboxymuconolactone decarboxylase family protein YurZ
MIVTLRHMEGMVLQALMGVMEEEIVEAIVVVMPDAAAEMEGAAAERTEEAEVAIKSLLVTSIAA